MKSVNEVCKLCGVSRRTLQYYDEIGLLLPSAVKESGYRLYDHQNLRRLWSILFYKELGLSLKDIRLILDSPGTTEKNVMRQHRQILLEKQSQLQKMVRSMDRILNDDFDISMLRDFDINKIEAIKKTYADEIRALIESRFFLPVAKSGLPLKNLYSVQSISKIMCMDWGKFIAHGREVSRKFSTALPDGPESSAARDAVFLLVSFINVLMPCDEATMRQIGQAYLNHKNELDKKEPGLAEFVYAAIKHAVPGEGGLEGPGGGESR